MSNKSLSNSNDNKLVEDFKNKEQFLSEDIANLDTRATAIQDFIRELDVQMGNIKNLIKTETDAGKKGKLYGLLNETMELNVKYHDLYLKCADIKRRYREEDNDLLIRKTRFFEIDLVKLDKNDTQDLGVGNLSMMFQTILEQLRGATNENASETTFDNIIGDLKSDSYRMD